VGKWQLTFRNHWQLSPEYVQLWARDNTDIESLFMPDPSHSYGGRDYSIRSSFGSLREWGYTGIAYLGNYTAYEDGRQRMNEFGIDIDSVTDEDLKTCTTFTYGQKLVRDIRKKYYSMSSSELLALADKYGIDYIIMNKKYLEPSSVLDMDIAYENDGFIVYKSY